MAWKIGSKYFSSVFTFYKGILLVCYLHKLLIVCSLSWWGFTFFDFFYCSCIDWENGNAPKRLAGYYCCLVLWGEKALMGSRENEIGEFHLSCHLTPVICQYTDNWELTPSEIDKLTFLITCRCAVSFTMGRKAISRLGLCRVLHHPLPRDFTLSWPALPVSSL